ncbi:MAG: GFA family protein [Gammaproteobacteria bacterium]|nr:GFA family protein [Gammaproteobacteria bacterium]
MAGTPIKMTDGCLCGAVRYETMGESFKVLHCHCQSYRKHNGGSVVTLAGFKAGQVRFSGDERKIYESSPGVGRAFCGKCGTPLTWEGDGGGRGPILELHISTFDNPNALKPSVHSFDAERIPWFDIADNLPRYEGLSGKSPLLRHGPAIEESGKLQ